MINLDQFKIDYPEVTAWDALQKFFNKNFDKGLVEIGQLRDNIGFDILTEDFVCALSILKKCGIIKREYRFLDEKTGRFIVNPEYVHFPFEARNNGEREVFVTYSWKT